MMLGEGEKDVVKEREKRDVKGISRYELIVRISCVSVVRCKIVLECFGEVRWIA